MPDGVAVARIHMQNIVVNHGENGSKFINVQDGDNLVVFLLDRSQCDHLADLLTDFKRPATNDRD
jgi:hypothetical protein